MSLFSVSRQTQVARETSDKGLLVLAVWSLTNVQEKIKLVPGVLAGH